MLATSVDKRLPVRVKIFAVILNVFLLLAFGAVTALYVKAQLDRRNDPPVALSVDNSCWKLPRVCLDRHKSKLAATNLTGYLSEIWTTSGKSVVPLKFEPNVWQGADKNEAAPCVSTAELGCVALGEYLHIALVYQIDISWDIYSSTRMKLHEPGQDPGRAGDIAQLAYIPVSPLNSASTMEATITLTKSFRRYLNGSTNAHYEMTESPTVDCFFCSATHSIPGA